MPGFHGVAFQAATPASVPVFSRCPKRTQSPSNPFKPHHFASAPNEPNPPVARTSRSAFFRSVLLHAKRTQFPSNQLKTNHFASAPNEPNPSVARGVPAMLAGPVPTIPVGPSAFFPTPPNEPNPPAPLRAPAVLAGAFTRLGTIELS